MKNLYSTQHLKSLTLLAVLATSTACSTMPAEPIANAQDAVPAISGGESPVVAMPALKVADPFAEGCASVTHDIRRVHFGIGSADLSSDGIGTLEGVASLMSDCKDATLNITAHTDKIGSHENNQLLSERRAVSVINQLRSLGVEQSRLNSQTLGETQPLNADDTVERRKFNRRVELEFKRRNVNLNLVY